MTDYDTKFTELLCTRFCHDIIGPVGAVNNGAEFLKEEMQALGTKSQAADLIESSAKEAVARVQFYRQAYGLASKGFEANLSEIRELTRNFFAASKVTVDWDDKYCDATIFPFSHEYKKLALNLFIIASAALIKGGVLKFAISQYGIFIEVAGDVVKLNEKIEESLKRNINEDDVDPKIVQSVYTYMLAKDMGVEIGITKDDKNLSFTINKKN